MYSPVVFGLTQLIGEMPYSVICAVAFFLLFCASKSPFLLCLCVSPLTRAPRLQTTRSASTRLPTAQATTVRPSESALSPLRQSLAHIATRVLTRDSSHTVAFVLLLEIYSVTLGQAFAALSPTEYIAEQMVPGALLIFVTFCGAVTALVTPLEVDTDGETTDGPNRRHGAVRRAARLLEVDVPRQPVHLCRRGHHDERDARPHHRGAPSLCAPIPSPSSLVAPQQCADSLRDPAAVHSARATRLQPSRGADLRRVGRRLHRCLDGVPHQPDRDVRVRVCVALIPSSLSVKEQTGAG